VQHGGGPFRHRHPESFAAQRGVPRGAVDQGQRRILMAAQRRQSEGAVRGGPDADGLGCRLGLGGQRICRG